MEKGGAHSQWKINQIRLKERAKISIKNINISPIYLLTCFRSLKSSFVSSLLVFFYHDTQNNGPYQ